MPEYTASFDLSDSQERAAELGSKPALIERFGIRGLYGYRTISLASQHAATILIAKNGTGKTTLMGALDAFLKLQLNRLRDLEFSEIFCKIRGYDEEVVLTHDDLVNFLQPPLEGEFAKLVSRTGIEHPKLFSFLLGDYKTALDGFYEDYDHSSLVNVMGRSFGNDPKRAIKACNDTYTSLFQRTISLANLRERIVEAFKDHEIVYLPTYRRVELALTDDGQGRRRRGRSRPKLSITASGLHTGEIQFGLGDISDRLAQLNDDIISRSNRGYREISENIINELIQGYEVSETAELPKPDELKLFFSRLESGKRLIGPYYTISAPDFERIYSGIGVPAESRKFLTYFLGKLNNIINITKEIEQPVGEFISSCNKYLSSIDPSTSLSGEAEHTHISQVDAKALKVDRTDLSVHVESVPARAPISLDALSSGEKQMISLFAKMYLYPKKKIVLIDEPELSLSIDWQRGILVDVLLSPRCEQVIAITHSPFVFDNSLEPFARTLELKISERSDPELNLKSLDDDSAEDENEG